MSEKIMTQHFKIVKYIQNKTTFFFKLPSHLMPFDRCGSQNNVPKYVRVLILRACEYVTLHSKGS